MRSEPEHAIVIKILPDGNFEEIFNGTGSLVWAHFGGKLLPSNGQYQISLKLLALSVTAGARIPRVV